MRTSGAAIRRRHRAATGTFEKREFASADEIRHTVAEERIELVGDILRFKAALLLGIDGDKIECNRPLLELGLDSLMAVEMRNWVESQIEIDLPISALMRSASLDHLTLAVCEIICEAPVPSANASMADEPQPIQGEQADSLLEQLPEMADDEVSRLLSQMLRQQNDG